MQQLRSLIDILLGKAREKAISHFSWDNQIFTRTTLFHIDDKIDE